MAQRDRSQRMQVALLGLRAASPDVTGACVVSRDGLIIAAELAEDTDEELVGAMAATALASAERLSREWLHGDLRQTWLVTSAGQVAIALLPGDAALMLMVRPEANAGLVQLGLRQAVAELSRVA